MVRIFFLMDMAALLTSAEVFLTIMIVNQILLMSLFFIRLTMRRPISRMIFLVVVLMIIPTTFLARMETTITLAQRQIHLEQLLTR